MSAFSNLDDVYKLNITLENLLYLNKVGKDSTPIVGFVNGEEPYG